jgi:hypothetical protein
MAEQSIKYLQWFDDLNKTFAENLIQTITTTVTNIVAKSVNIPYVKFDLPNGSQLLIEGVKRLYLKVCFYFNIYLRLF